MKWHYCRFMNSNALFAEEIQSFLMEIWNKNESKNICNWRKKRRFAEYEFFINRKVADDKYQRGILSF
jgi:hypothetical protein